MISDPSATYTAVQELKLELPLILAEADWNRLEPELTKLDMKWVGSEEGVPRLRLAAEYRSLLAEYPIARDRLRQLMRDTDRYRDSLLYLADLAEREGASAGSASLRAIAEYDRSTRYIFEQGVGRKAYSLKLSNFDFRFWNLAPVAGSLIATIDAYLDPSSSTLAFAAALLLAAGGARLLVEELSVDTTSVFLGLIQAANPNREGDLKAIIIATNAERGRIYMEPLSDNQVQRELLELHQLGSVEPVDHKQDAWRIVEEYGRI